MAKLTVVILCSTLELLQAHDREQEAGIVTPHRIAYFQRGYRVAKIRSGSTAKSSTLSRQAPIEIRDTYIPPKSSVSLAVAERLPQQ